MTSMIVKALTNQLSDKLHHFMVQYNATLFDKGKGMQHKAQWRMMHETFSWYEEYNQILKYVGNDLDIGFMLLKAGDT